MRRIFPLKSGSSSNHHGQQNGGAGPAPAPLPPKENSRVKGTFVSSRYAQDLPKNSPTASRGRKSETCPSNRKTDISPGIRRPDASTSQDVNLLATRGGASSKREHWCPGCPPDAERCGTPPSGDENTESKEVEKVVISCPSPDPHKLAHRHPIASQDSIVRQARQALDLDVSSFDSVVAAVMRGDGRGPALVKSSSKRSGLGTVDNLMHERTASKPPTKSKGATAAPPQEQAPRSTSVPKVRITPRASPLSEPPRLHSMRILKLPDRVLEATSSLSSSESNRGSDASSSNESSAPQSATPRARAAAYERERYMNQQPLLKAHSRAHSFSEGYTSSRPPVSSPSLGRSPIGSPRSFRKELGTSAAVPSTAAVDAVLSKVNSNKYSGARVVAEKLAKAFRSSSKTKDSSKGSTTDGDRRTKLGQSTRMTSRAEEELADSSYDGSCSDTSYSQTGDDHASYTNVLQLVKHGDAHSQSSLRESAGSNGEKNGLSWQEFVIDGRVPEGLLNDHPTPEKSSPETKNQISKNLGAAPGSRRWASANDENESITKPQSHVSSQQEKEREKEREILKGWLEGLKRQSEGMADDLEMKARMAEHRISVLNGEQSFESPGFLSDLQCIGEEGNSNIVAGINIMQQRIKRMHEEKKRLALEVASEVKRRVTERAAAKEVLVMMKREMEACVRVMEKEKMGIQDGFERELERRANEWSKTLENIRLEEKWLRDRVRRLEEEKGALQSELAAEALKEDSLREKVTDFELQMEGHRKRVDGAERTILDLRQSLVSSCQQARQAEGELDTVRKAYVEKECQSQDLANQVERLQQLCVDHENSIDGLQQGLTEGSERNEQTSDSVRKELVRLSKVEKTLRDELEALRSETISLRSVNDALVERLGNMPENLGSGGYDLNLQAEVTSLQFRTTQLQEENKSLSMNLQLAEKERDSGREVLKTLEANLIGVEEESKALQDEVGRERNKVQEKERELHRLERRVDGLLKNNQMLQGILAMREKAALVSDEEVKEKERAVKEAYQLEAEMRDSLQVSARQLFFMNERAELMSEKLKEREVQLMALKNDCGKKDDAIRGLEQSLSDLARSMDAQNRRIMQLTTKNGELSRHVLEGGKGGEGLQLRNVEDSHGRMSSQEIDQISVQMNELKLELEAQNLLCKLLRDKLAHKEDELSKRCEEVAGLRRSRDWFQAELQRAQAALGEASQKLASLELMVNQKEEVIASWKAGKQGYLQDLLKLREALPQVEHERDEMRVEADEIGREALRLSAEVEVLRRKVAQLEEDVLLKEGQICILRGSFTGSE